jgi:hypothetical protein
MGYMGSCSAAGTCGVVGAEGSAETGVVLGAAVQEHSSPVWCTCSTWAAEAVACGLRGMSQPSLGLRGGEPSAGKVAASRNRPAKQQLLGCVLRRSP